MSTNGRKRRGWVRALGSALVGYGVMIVLTIAQGAALYLLFPGQFVDADGNLVVPGIGWFALHLIFVACVAAFAGFVTRRLSQNTERSPVAILLGIVVLMGGVSLFVTEQVPLWWTLGELAIGLPAVLVGDRLGLRAVSP